MRVDVEVAEGRVEALLSRMTLKEKVGQMTQVTLHPLCVDGLGEWEAARLDSEKLREAVAGVGVGSIFNVAGRPLDAQQWRRLISEIQEVAVSESRLGIPVLYGIDAVHGAGYTAGATLFPHNLSLAATWRPELVREASRITAEELREAGISWNFAPVLDVGRQPLWSRFFETFGEDVLVVTRLGEASVAGHRDVPFVAACAKHFVGYSAPSTGRDRTTAWLPEHLLRELYLPPFRAAVNAGVPTVMVNSGDINAVPVHASRALLTDLLRGELGFEGVIVTDWEDVIKLHTMHRVAPTVKEAVRMAVDAGIDMSMTPFDFDFARLLEELVLEGSLPENRIDASVRRILMLKEGLGLFDHPVPPGAGRPRAERVRASRDMAGASLVLLENHGILPFDAGARVALSGPGADSLPALCGPWSFTWQGNDAARYPESMQTVRDALGQANLLAAGPESADAVLLCLMEDPSVEKPGDINRLDLDAEQESLAQRTVKGGKPVVAVLFFERPRVLGDWVDECAAVIWAGRPGPHGGAALADLMTGRIQPEGRLPFTYPRHSGALIPYDHRRTDRLGTRYGLYPDFAFDAFDPRWRFGFGLSFGEFEYRDLSVEVEVDRVMVGVSVANLGHEAVRETVQLYVSDHFAAVSPPVERLRDWKNVIIGPGERVAVGFSVRKSELGYFGPDGYVVEPGTFSVHVGGLSQEFHLTHP